MLWGISFCVGNKTIEVNNQEFSLGELTAECLNISVDDYTAMRKAGHQAARYMEVYEATNTVVSRFCLLQIMLLRTLLTK